MFRLTVALLASLGLLLLLGTFPVLRLVVSLAGVGLMVWAERKEK